MKLSSWTMFVVSALVAPSAYADSHQIAQPSQASAIAVSTTRADGEVRKVDRDASKITLKHGEIKSLEMPPMTMVFPVKDKTLLDKVKAGDKVRFSVEKQGGTAIVTAIDVVK
jgi:Cu/Ag efflux protein CusF